MSKWRGILNRADDVPTTADVTSYRCNGLPQIAYSKP